MSRTRVGFPRLGSFGTFLKPALRPLGLDLVVAPPSTRHTLDLGIRHNPEMICTPCKLLFGNYVQALEQGCQVLVMLGGPGTCRLGYSARLQETWLREMGFEFQAYTIDVVHMARDAVRFLRSTSDASWGELIETIRFLLALMQLVDEVEQRTLYLRPRVPGHAHDLLLEVDRAREEALSNVEALPDRAALGERREALLSRLKSIPVDEHTVGARCTPLRVGVVGDLYTMQESFFNMHLERELGRLGVHVERCFWIGDSLRNRLQESVLHRGYNVRRTRAAEPYLSHDIGGFARGTVGSAALFTQEGVDGLIHLAPFSCTPEVMAHNALLALQRECRVPILSLSFDEHTGRAGLLTRLEAFVDLMERRRLRQPVQPSPAGVGWRKGLSFPLSGLLESLEERLSEGMAALLQGLHEGAQASGEDEPSDPL
jgi:hypothetical protein